MHETDETRHLRQVKQRFELEAFPHGVLGIRIQNAHPGSSQLILESTPEVRNAHGNVMGGAIFTLVDVAAGTAVYEEGFSFLTVESSIQFVNQAMGSHLIARGREVKRGRRLSFCTVEVANDKGRLIAMASVTMTRLRIDGEARC